MADNNGTDLNLLAFHIKEEYSPTKIKVEEIDVEIIKTEAEVSGGSWVYQNVDVNELQANENWNLENFEEQLLNANSGIKREASGDYLKVWETINNLSTNRQEDNKNGLDLYLEEKVSQQHLIETGKINNKKAKLKFLHDHNYCLSTRTLKKKVLVSQKKCEQPYKCNECPYATADNRELLSHIHCRHTMEKPYKCNECAYAAVRKQQIQRHIKSHHTLGKLHGPVQKCDIAHIQFHRSMEKLFKCNECSYVAVQKRCLLSHIKAHHTIEKPYKCNECAYATICKQRLVIHIRSQHTKEKPYKCNKCSYAAVQKYYLLSHIKSHHTVVKPYKTKKTTPSSH